MTSNNTSPTVSPYATIDKEASESIFVVRFTGEKATDDNFKAYLAGLKDLYTDHTSLAIIFDAQSASFPGLKYQRWQGEWLKENEELIRNHCAGTAYVIPNALIRTALKGIFTFQKQPTPYHVTKSKQDALGWARIQLIEFL